MWCSKEAWLRALEAEDFSVITATTTITPSDMAGSSCALSGGGASGGTSGAMLPLMTAGLLSNSDTTLPKTPPHRLSGSGTAAPRPTSRVNANGALLSSLAEGATAHAPAAVTSTAGVEIEGLVAPEMQPLLVCTDMGPHRLKGIQVRRLGEGDGWM